eukprot:Platyproteum_vivax@DN4194_c0_g1_i1.p1
MSVIDQILSRPVNKAAAVPPPTAHRQKKPSHDLLAKVKPLDLSSLTKPSRLSGSRQEGTPSWSASLPLQRKSPTVHVKKKVEIPAEKKEEKKKNLISLNRNMQAILTHPEKLPELQGLKEIKKIERKIAATNNDQNKEPKLSFGRPGYKYDDYIPEEKPKAKKGAKVIKSPLKPHTKGLSPIRKVTSGVDLRRKAQTFKNHRPLNKPTSRVAYNSAKVQRKPPSFLLDEVTQEDLDFIDDAGDTTDWRTELRAATGYIPSQYSDDDDDSMEVGFTEQLKEDLRSRKLGELEDIKEENSEKLRLQQKKRRLEKRN